MKIFRCRPNPDNGFDTIIRDVVLRKEPNMGLFDRKNGGVMDQIRCDEPSYLIWKWHPTGSQAWSNNRENAIRWGSSLRVKDGEVAVFVYNQRNGCYQDYIEGPYDGIIQTDNLPVIATAIGMAYAGGTPFQAEIYFINLARIIQVKFGVPFFDVYDPRFADFGIPVAARGTISFRINDYHEFIKLHRLAEFGIDDFQRQIRDSIIRYVKDAITNAPAAHNIPIVQIESKISEINDAIEYDISQRLMENFGVCVSGVDIGAIEIDKSSDSYLRLMAVTQDITAESVKAQTDVNIKQMYDKQRIEAENYAESLRIQREEAQYVQHKQTQTSHYAAFQTEAQVQVGVAGAEALGKMGANGAGGVDLGNAGFNPAAMMTSMAIGGAIGQNISGTMSGMMNSMNQPMHPGMVPPPIPVVQYHVAINGQAVGPFDMNALKQMAVEGKIARDTLVWKQGMENWTIISMVNELSDICAVIPPAIK